MEASSKVMMMKMLCRLRIVAIGVCYGALNNGGLLQPVVSANDGGIYRHYSE